MVGVRGRGDEGGGEPGKHGLTSGAHMDELEREGGGELGEKAQVWVCLSWLTGMSHGDKWHG